MRAILAAVLATCCLAAPAGASAVLTPLGGTLGSPFQNGRIHGTTYQFSAQESAGQGLFTLYNNIPTVVGGPALPGTVMGGQPAGFLFLDYENPSAQGGDDLHGIHDVHAPGRPVVVTSLWYAYLNQVATTTHIVKIYDMLPPIDNHGTMITPYTDGPLLASIVAPGMPAGAMGVTLSVPDLVLPHSSVWIKLEETGSGFPATYWLAGGIPAAGYSHIGVTYTVKEGPYAANLWMPYPYMGNNSGVYTQANVSLALGGHALPAPAAISLLGVAGLVTLTRRRARQDRLSRRAADACR